MIVTIAAIVLFQIYWLRKNYVEENKLLTLRANLLFRETLFRMQASKLHLDTSLHFKFPEPLAPMSLLSTANIIKERVFMDSQQEKEHGHSIVVTVRGETKARLPDTATHEVFFQKQGNVGVTAFLSSVDSLQQPVTIREIQEKFRQVLSKEGIPSSFIVKATPMARGKDELVPDAEEGSVILGLAKPIAYQVYLQDTVWLIARRLGPQFLFSLVLIGVTILSFLLLYRNWRQQQKLIQLKNDFISNITHELKTPIATVSVAVEALKEFDALKDPVRTKEYLEISSHELQRLSLLVDKVLKLSLFEKQEIELRKDDFDLKVLVEEILASMRLQFEKYHATVRLMAGHNEPGMLQLRADKLHFTSVIYNLLDNALKYSAASPEVVVDVHGDEDHIHLSVSDNGIGIPAGYKERIFEKFFRVPTGDHHNVKGYGLGLSYVAYVVDRHGGTIEVGSEEGVGSHFIIKIPKGYV
jgi:two-component system phosphate regulon sensor histidine kinase PhoR